MANLKAVLDSIDDLPEAVQELYSKKGEVFELTGIEGVKTQADIDRLTKTLNTERDAHKAAKARLATFGDLNPEEVHAKLDKYDELEAAASGKLDDDKINEMVERRTKSSLAPKDREIKRLTDENAALKAERDALKTADSRRQIHDAVRKAATGQKIIDTAIEDALLMGERTLQVDEDGEVRTKDGVSASDWLLDLKERRPHWWPATQGGGARGSGGGGGYSNNPWTKDHWNATEQTRIYREKGADHAKKMAEAAGTTLGGPKPTK